MVVLRHILILSDMTSKTTVIIIYISVAVNETVSKQLPRHQEFPYLLSWKSQDTFDTIEALFNCAIVQLQRNVVQF